MLLYLLSEYYNSRDGKLHINPNSVLLVHKLRMIFKLDWKKSKEEHFIAFENYTKFKFQSPKIKFYWNMAI